MDFQRWERSCDLRLDRRMSGLPSSSAGKESACNAGDPDSIPGSGRSPEKGIGYPLQYSWASLVAQTVKNPPAKQETWVRSLDWKDPMEEGMATHSSILAWRLLMAGYSPWCKESDTTEQPTTAQRRRMSRILIGKEQLWQESNHFRGVKKNSQKISCLFSLK